MEWRCEVSSSAVKQCGPMYEECKGKDTKRANIKVQQRVPWLKLDHQ